MATRHRAYCRRSDDAGTAGIDAQKRAIRDHLRAQGIIGPEEDIIYYEDDDVPGWISIRERPGGADCIRDAQNGEYDVLWVYNIRRLGRELYFISEAEYLLRQAGVKLQSVSEKFDPHEAGGAVMLGLHGGISQEDRLYVLSNLANGATDCAHKGFWLGGKCTYGYDIVPDKKEPRRKRMVPCHKKFPQHPDWTPARLIQAIYDFTLTKGWTCVQVARYLDSIGLPTYWVPGHPKYGEPQYYRWTEQKVRALIANSTYKGDYSFGGGQHRKKKDPRTGEIIPPQRPEPIPRTCEALVSPEDWKRAQELMHERQSKAVRNGKREYLLRGFVVCACCGRSYIGSPQIGRKLGRFYVCMGSKQPDCAGKYCRASYWADADALENEVKDRVAAYLLNPSTLIDLFREQMGGDKEAVEDYRAGLAALERARRALQRQRMNYQHQQAEDLIILDELRHRPQGLQTKDQGIAVEVVQLTAGLAAPERVDAELREAEQSPQELEDGWTLYTHEEWRRWIERFVSKITIHTAGGFRKRQTHAEIEWKMGANGNCGSRG